MAMGLQPHFDDMIDRSSKKRNGESNPHDPKP